LSVYSLPPPPFVFAVTIPFCGCDAPHLCPTYMRTVFPFILVSSLYHYYYLPCSGTCTLTNHNLPNRQQNTEPNHGPPSPQLQPQLQPQPTQPTPRSSPMTRPQSTAAAVCSRAYGGTLRRMRFVWALGESGCEDVRDGEGKAEGDGVKARQARSRRRRRINRIERRRGMVWGWWWRRRCRRLPRGRGK
jgi:hypothetical protein